MTEYKALYNTSNTQRDILADARYYEVRATQLRNQYIALAVTKSGKKIAALTRTLFSGPVRTRSA